MCTVLLPPGDNPIAVNKYISYIICRSDLAHRDWRVNFTDLRCSVILLHSNVCVCVHVCFVSESHWFFCSNVLKQIQIVYVKLRHNLLSWDSSFFSESASGLGSICRLCDNDWVCKGCEILFIGRRCSLSISRLLTCQTVHTGICCYWFEPMKSRAKFDRLMTLDYLITVICLCLDATTRPGLNP